MPGGVKEASLHPKVSSPTPSPHTYEHWFRQYCSTVMWQRKPMTPSMRQAQENSGSSALREGDKAYIVLQMDGGKRAGGLPQEEVAATAQLTEWGCATLSRFSKCPAIVLQSSLPKPSASHNAILVSVLQSPPPHFPRSVTCIAPASGSKQVLVRSVAPLDCVVISILHHDTAQQRHVSTRPPKAPLGKQVKQAVSLSPLPSLPGVTPAKTVVPEPCYHLDGLPLFRA